MKFPACLENDDRLNDGPTDRLTDLVIGEFTSFKAKRY